jgi:hypothetical protein
MKTKKFLFYLLAALLGGCVPVLSLHQLYTDKDIVFEEKLLGTWIDDKEPNDKNIWQFSNANKPEKAYNLIFSDNKDKKGAFIAHLVKLQDKLFLDVYPSEPPGEQEDPNTIKWPYNFFLAIPCHTFIKIDSIEPNLTMRMTDDEKMKELFKEEPNATEHTTIEDKPLLTASTEKLQAFVLKYADDKRLFGEAGILTRKKTKDSNEPNSIEPNTAPKRQ